MVWLWKSPLLKGTLRAQRQSHCAVILTDIHGESHIPQVQNSLHWWSWCGPYINPYVLVFLCLYFLVSPSIAWLLQFCYIHLSQTFIVSHPLRPTCQWFKDGVKLNEKSHQINNKERTLTIKSASPDDNGLYYCCAKNAAGHVCSNSNFTLKIIGVCFVILPWSNVWILLCPELTDDVELALTFLWEK